MIEMGNTCILMWILVPIVYWHVGILEYGFLCVIGLSIVGRLCGRFVRRGSGGIGYGRVSLILVGAAELGCVLLWIGLVLL